MHKEYDYIICGMGCAGLSLALRMCHPDFSQKRILILDKEIKNRNDRTWCFWEKNAGFFEEIVYGQWNYLWFHNEDYSSKIDISPYTYKMIRGIDFYDFALTQIQATNHIEVKTEEISSIEDNNSYSIVRCKDHQYHGKYVFSSIFTGNIDKKKHNYVDQHFRGWVIHSELPVFDPLSAVFMDFRTKQNNECRFLYILPRSANKALVELAIFSNEILPIKQYEIILKDYIAEYLRIDQYSILEKEFGVIPMTVYPFENSNSTRIKYIGTAGGVAKASTGYAFQRIQKHSDIIVSLLRKDQVPDVPESFFKNRFRWYDKVLLNVLLKNRISLSKVFGKMFEKLPPDYILKFLNNETTISEEIRILNAPPAMPFIKAAINEFIYCYQQAPQ